MTRCTTILIMCVALLAACNTPRKACRKANRHIARAVWLCPEVLKADSAKATISLPGDSITGTLEYTQQQVDSILEACAELGRSVELVDTVPAEVVYVHTVATKKAVDRFRSKVCRPAPVHLLQQDLSLRIWVDSITGEIRYLAKVFPQVIDLTVPCPPEVRPVPKDQVEVCFWTSWWAWVIILLIAGWWAYIRFRNARG